MVQRAEVNKSVPGDGSGNTIKCGLPENTFHIFVQSFLVVTERNNNNRHDGDQFSEYYTDEDFEKHIRVLT